MKSHVAALPGSGSAVETGPRSPASGVLHPSSAVISSVTSWYRLAVSGGALEHAQEMAAHESPRTTKLYDRTGDEITPVRFRPVATRSAATLQRAIRSASYRDAPAALCAAQPDRAVLICSSALK